jgi:hypothetical protein
VRSSSKEITGEFSIVISVVLKKGGSRIFYFHLFMYLLGLFGWILGHIDFKVLNRKS